MGTIVDFVEPVKTNEYTPEVEALIAAGPGKADIITAPAADAAKAQRLFQKAANQLEHTAKLRLTETEGEGDEAIVRLTFTLTKRHKARRNAEREAAKVEGADAAETAPEAAPTDTPEPEPTEAPENVPTPRARKR